MKKFICCFALLALFSALLSGCAGSREVTFNFKYPAPIPLTEPIEIRVESTHSSSFPKNLEVQHDAIIIQPGTLETKLEVKPDRLSLSWDSPEVGSEGTGLTYGFRAKEHETLTISLSPIKISYAEKLPEPFYYKLKSKPTIFKNIELSWVDQGLLIRSVGNCTMKLYGLALGADAHFCETSKGIQCLSLSGHVINENFFEKKEDLLFPLPRSTFFYVSGETPDGLYYAYKIWPTENLTYSNPSEPPPVEGGVNIFPILDDSKVPYRNEFIVQCSDQERAEEVYFSEYERNKKSNESYYKPAEPVK